MAAVTMPGLNPESSAYTTLNDSEKHLEKTLYCSGTKLLQDNSACRTTDIKVLPDLSEDLTV